MDEATTLEDLVERAAELGREHGTAGGSWVFDGNTEAAEYVKCLELDEEGAPEWFDFYGPMSAPLSGEWADGLTPWTLGQEVGYQGDNPDTDEWERISQEICDAYEQAYYDAWREEVLRMARYQVEGEK